MKSKVKSEKKEENKDCCFLSHSDSFVFTHFLIHVTHRLVSKPFRKVFEIKDHALFNIPDMFTLNR